MSICHIVIFSFSSFFFSSSRSPYQDSKQSKRILLLWKKKAQKDLLLLLKNKSSKKTRRQVYLKLLSSLWSEGTTFGSTVLIFQRLCQTNHPAKARKEDHKPAKARKEDHEPANNLNQISETRVNNNCEYLVALVLLKLSNRSQVKSVKTQSKHYLPHQRNIVFMREDDWTVTNPEEIKGIVEISHLMMIVWFKNHHRS